MRLINVAIFRAVISPANPYSSLSHQNHGPWPNTHQVNNQCDLQHFHWTFYVRRSFDMHEINHNFEYFIQTLIQFEYTNQNNVAIVVTSAAICVVVFIIMFKLYGLFREHDGTRICVFFSSFKVNFSRWIQKRRNISTHKNIIQSYTIESGYWRLKSYSECYEITSLQ